MFSKTFPRAIKVKEEYVVYLDRPESLGLPELKYHIIFVLIMIVGLSANFVTKISPDMVKLAMMYTIYRSLPSHCLFIYLLDLYSCLSYIHETKRLIIKIISIKRHSTYIGSPFLHAHPDLVCQMNNLFQSSFVKFGTSV